MKNKFIYASKIGMSQSIDTSGIITPVTLLKVVDTRVLKVTIGSFSTVKVGVHKVDSKKISRPLAGQFKSLDSPTYKILKSFNVLDNSFFQEGSDISLKDLFQENEKISVTGFSKGKGFSGTVKRHNFRIGRKSHGSKSKRAPGSIGGGTDPGRVFKGQKMPGRLGNVKVTKVSYIYKVDLSKNLIYIKGSVPGCKSSLVLLSN
jgi:large subunit ribosomal protein L3